MKVKLFWIELSLKDWQEKIGDKNYYSGNFIMEACGSHPKLPGTNVEGLIVPDNIVWLFPMGDYIRLENKLKACRITDFKRCCKTVNI